MYTFAGFNRLRIQVSISLLSTTLEAISSSISTKFSIMPMYSDIKNLMMTCYIIEKLLVLANLEGECCNVG